MENAAEALKMAAAVLVFVLAISIALNAFGQVRQTSQILLDYNDREYDYTYVLDNGTTNRIVSSENIIPAIYKAYKENFKIIFKDIDKHPLEIYRKKISAINTKSVYYIDLEKEALANDNQKEEFIKAILYGNKIDNWDAIQQKYLLNQKIILNNNGLYDIIKGHRFEEYMGIYYQEEIYNITDSSSNPDANKTEKRIITYIMAD